MVKNNEVHKTSYRQTEIGQIPNDWDMVSMEGLGKTYGGLTGKTKKDFQNGKHPYITFLNVILHPIINSEKFDYVNLRRSENQNKTIIGDLFFNGSSETPEEIGMCSVLMDSFEDLYLNSFCFGYRLFNTKTINPLFISYFFRSPLGRKIIYSLAQGATRYNLSKTNFLKLQIPLPKIEEQTAIATALSDTDALIESLEKLIEKKRNIKQGVMQELLMGKRRLEGFEDKWILNELGEIAHIKTGNKNNQDKVEDGVYPFFVRSQKIERINTYSYEGEAILIPGEGNIGNIYHYVNGRFDYHQRVYKISNFSNAICGKFVFYQMYQNFYNHAVQNSVKATVDSLRLPTFRNFKVNIPSNLEEQVVISNIISDLESVICMLEQKLNKYRMIKQGMMQVLLTGKIRLI